MIKQVTKIALGILITGIIFLPAGLEAARTIGDAVPFVTQVAPSAGVSQADLPTTVGNVIKIALSLVGTIFFGLMFYAGYLWFTARGNDEKIEKAKGAITAAIIGVAVSVSAYAITNLAVNRLILRKGGPATEAVGCCYDWVASNREIDIKLNPPIPTWRMTTYTDCKYQGETKGVGGDYWSGPEEKGYWQFDLAKDQTQCAAQIPPIDWNLFSWVP